MIGSKGYIEKGRWVMKSLTVVLAATVVLILSSMRVEGQTFDLQFVEVLNNGVNYDVKIQIKSNTSTFNIGTSNLVFTYNTSALSSPTLLAIHNFSGTNYGTMDLTGTTQKSLNIYLNFGAVGTAVELSFMDVATIRFTTTDPAGSSNLQWVTSGGAPTVVYKDDESTPVSVGTLSNLNTSPLPIQMASFAANVVRGNDVEVAWKTVSETNNYGFEVYRKRNENGVWNKLGFIEGHGTTLAAQSYTYLDKSVGFGNYFYQIKQIDLDGKSETFPEMNVVVGVAPDQLVLAQNYPNPFNPTTTIEFVVPITAHTTMKLYNVLGQEVATLFEGDAEAGRINVARFNASNLASGLYFYTLRSAGKVGTKRMLLMK